MLTAKYELIRIGEKGELQNLLYTPTTKIIRKSIFLALEIKKDIYYFYILYFEF